MAQGAALGLLAVAVAYSRTYLGYHTIIQVRALARLTTVDVLHPEPLADVIGGQAGLQQGPITGRLYIATYRVLLSF